MTLEEAMKEIEKINKEKADLLTKIKEKEEHYNSLNLKVEELTKTNEDLTNANNSLKESNMNYFEMVMTQNKKLSENGTLPNDEVVEETTPTLNDIVNKF